MMFVGEDQYQGEECNHYQITDKERNVSFGFLHRGFIQYGYKTIWESKETFRRDIHAALDPNHTSPLEKDDEDFDINDII
jgi:hypothetical protein